MRRIALLALLALTLPTTAFSSIIQYFNGPCSVNGTTCIMGKPVGGSSYNVLSPLAFVNGIAATGSVHFTAPSLTADPNLADCGNQGAFCFTFSGSSLVVTDTTNPAMSFTELNVFHGFVAMTLSNGHIQSLVLQATDDAVTQDFRFGTMLSGNTFVSVAPEPGTLGLLGTGLIGLAAVARRKNHGR